MYLKFGKSILHCPQIKLFKTQCRPNTTEICLASIDLHPSFVYPHQTRSELKGKYLNEIYQPKLSNPNRDSQKQKCVVLLLFSPSFIEENQNEVSPEILQPTSTLFPPLLRPTPPPPRHNLVFSPNLGVYPSTITHLQFSNIHWWFKLLSCFV